MAAPSFNSAGKKMCHSLNLLEQSAGGCNLQNFPTPNLVALHAAACIALKKYYTTCTMSLEFCLSLLRSCFRCARSYEFDLHKPLFT